MKQKSLEWANENETKMTKMEWQTTELERWKEEKN